MHQARRTAAVKLGIGAILVSLAIFPVSTAIAVPVRGAASSTSIVASLSDIWCC